MEGEKQLTREQTQKWEDQFPSRNAYRVLNTLIATGVTSLLIGIPFALYHDSRHPELRESYHELLYGKDFQEENSMSMEGQR